MSGGRLVWDGLRREGDQPLHSITAVPNTNIVLAVGDKGTVLRGTVDGDQVQWDAPNTQGNQNLRGIAAIPNSNIVLAVGENGAVLRGTVSGNRVQWDAAIQQGEQHLIGVTALPNTNIVLAVGEKGDFAARHGERRYSALDHPNTARQSGYYWSGGGAQYQDCYCGRFCRHHDA